MSDRKIPTLATPAANALSWISPPYERLLGDTIPQPQCLPPVVCLSRWWGFGAGSYAWGGGFWGRGGEEEVAQTTSVVWTVADGSTADAELTKPIMYVQISTFLSPLMVQCSYYLYFTEGTTPGGVPLILGFCTNICQWSLHLHFWKKSNAVLIVVTLRPRHFSRRWHFDMESCVFIGANFDMSSLL